MFLIDHDQPEVAERQVERRARAHDQLRRPLPHHAPAAAAFGHGDAGMPLGGLRPEARLDAGQELRCQGDLGQQHQRLPPLPQTFRDRLQVDFRLARPGDALQQRGSISAVPDPRHQGCHRRRLAFRQRLAGPVGVKRQIGRIPRGIHLLDRALRHQPLDDRGGCARHLGQFLLCEGQPAIFLQHRQHAGAGVGHPVGRLHPQTVELFHRGRIGQPRRAGGQPQHGAHRRQRVGPGAGQERAHLGTHRGHVQHLEHGPHLRRIPIAAPRPPDDADHLARTEGHHHEGAHPAAALGRLVIQHPIQRLGRQHANQRAFFEVVGHCHVSANTIRVPATLFLRYDMRKPLH